MGQYHKFVNLTKREFFRTDSGVTQMELAHNNGAALLVPLLGISNCRGGGDVGTEDVAYHPEDNTDGVLGRWAGDIVVLVGDYTVDAVFPAYPWPDHKPSDIYDLCNSTINNLYGPPDELTMKQVADKLNKARMEGWERNLKTLKDDDAKPAKPVAWKVEQFFKDVTRMVETVLWEGCGPGASMVVLDGADLREPDEVDRMVEAEVKAMLEGKPKPEASKGASLKKVRA